MWTAGANVMPGVWLPSTPFGRDRLERRPRRRGGAFKPDADLGISGAGAERSGSLTTIRVDEPRGRHDRAGRAAVAGARPAALEQEAEANVIERLETVGLLSPPGERTRFETVLNNLVVTNNLTSSGRCTAGFC
jgi:hypothetical protein